MSRFYATRVCGQKCGVWLISIFSFSFLVALAYRKFADLKLIVNSLYAIWRILSQAGVLHPLANFACALRAQAQHDHFGRSDIISFYNIISLLFYCKSTSVIRYSVLTHFAHSNWNSQDFFMLHHYADARSAIIDKSLVHWCLLGEPKNKVLCSLDIFYTILWA